MRKYCETCGMIHDVIIKEEERTYKVKDIETTENLYITYCNVCQNEVYNKEMELKNDIIMFNAYEERLDELFVDEEDEVYARKCSECGKEITQGYCIDGGIEYYCSDECLHKHYTEEEWREKYEDGGDSYWTNWEE